MKTKLMGNWFGVLAVVVSLLATPTSRVQAAGGISRVGWLEVCGQARRPYFDIFRRRLGELGYVEGKNLFIEQRFAECHYDRMPSLAVELAQMPVDFVHHGHEGITDSR
jgi:putative tryptophan/tyrosine transport system substrate-binding protein